MKKRILKKLIIDSIQSVAPYEYWEHWSPLAMVSCVVITTTTTTTTIVYLMRLNSTFALQFICFGAIQYRRQPQLEAQN